MANSDDINQFVPSLLNPRAVRKSFDNDLSQLSATSRLSLSLKRSRIPLQDISQLQNTVQKNKNNFSKLKEQFTIPDQRVYNKSYYFPVSNPGDCLVSRHCIGLSKYVNDDLKEVEEPQLQINTDINEKITQAQIMSEHSDETEIYSYTYYESTSGRPHNTFNSSNASITDNNDKIMNYFKDSNCCIKKLELSDTEADIVIECRVKQNTSPEIINSNGSFLIKEEEIINSKPTSEGKFAPHPKQVRKRKYPASKKAVTLILKQTAVKTYSHIVVQPPNCKFVKKKTNPGNASISRTVVKGAAQVKQSRITHFLRNGQRFEGGEVAEQSSLHSLSSDEDCVFVSCTGDYVGAACNNINARMSRDDGSNVTRKNLRRAVSLVAGKEVVTRASKPKTSGSLPLTPPAGPRLRPVPPYKIITGLSLYCAATLNWMENTVNFHCQPGRDYPYHLVSKEGDLLFEVEYKPQRTHFIVDGFNYGGAPATTKFFLTHFHSDHYCGLSKAFKNILYCSKITAELCTSRLGVNKKCIHIINIDEVHNIDGVEVMALDANHCPGALMLLFSLKNGKNVLHCGDFRASYQMESSPAFWNKQIHTIYLDTTYCNPRYDFPSQDESIQMALRILHQKKKDLEQKKKAFSKVLIVCGTYTVGKEKFFLGIAESEGFTLWATPERSRTLQTMHDCSFCRVLPREAQMHLLPMRDLTHEKLKIHLDSMMGAFTEVVAFKPSGWEVNKGYAKPYDNITIHGIPYSEHSSFPELLRFVKYLQPKLVIPTVDVVGGIKTVQKYFPCPLVSKDDISQKRMTDFFTASKNTHQPAIT